MIELFFLIKTVDLIICLLLAWQGILWYSRIEAQEYRAIGLLAFSYALRMLDQQLIYFLYYSGYSGFLSYLQISEFIEILLTMAGVYYLTLSIQHISRATPYELMPWLKWVLLIMFCFAPLSRFLDIAGFISPSYTTAIAFGQSMALAVLLGASAVYLFIIARYVIGRGILSKILWYQLFLLCLIMPIVQVGDHMVHEGFWIQTSRILYPSRLLSSAVLVLILGPPLLMLFSIHSRLRGLTAFTDVDEALASLKRDAPVDEYQEELFRAFLTRGWSDTINRYGLGTAKKLLQPILLVTGHHSILALMHYYQAKQHRYFQTLH